MIKAYNLETKELLKKYKTQQEVADDFDLTIEAVKGYFYRYKVYGDAKILNHKTGVWCYLARENGMKKPNYKERCIQAIEYINKHDITIWNNYNKSELLGILLGDTDENY